MRWARIESLETGADPGFLPGEGAKGLMTLYGMDISDFDIRKHRFVYTYNDILNTYRGYSCRGICNFSRCLLSYYAGMVLSNHSRDTSVPSFCLWDEGTRASGAGPSVPGMGAGPSTPPPGSAPGRCDIFCISGLVTCDSLYQWRRQPSGSG